MPGLVNIRAQLALIAIAIDRHAILVTPVRLPAALIANNDESALQVISGWYLGEFPEHPATLSAHLGQKHKLNNLSGRSDRADSIDMGLDYLTETQSNTSSQLFIRPVAL